MKVYLIMQSEELAYEELIGPSRVREAWSTRQEAEDAIGPVEEKYIKCETCGTSHINKKADLDSDGNPWKKKLFIKEIDILRKKPKPLSARDLTDRQLHREIKRRRLMDSGLPH